MSQGSKIMPVRFEVELLEEMLAQIWSSNESRKGEPWSVSDFIRTAVREKLRKMERSRATRRLKS